MKRRYLYLLILLLLLILAVLSFEKIFHYAVLSYKDEIEDQIEELVQRDCVISEIETELFPLADIILKDINFPPLVEGGETITVSGLSLEADIMTLLFGAIEIDEIHLRDFDPRLIGVEDVLDKITVKTALDVSDEEIHLKDFIIEGSAKKIPFSIQGELLTIRDDYSEISLDKGRIVSNSREQNIPLRGEVFLSLKARKDESEALKVNAELKGEKIFIRDGKEAHSVNRVVGELEFNAGKDKKGVLTGALNFDRYSYSDETTAVKEVKANLPKLSITFSPNGDVKADLDLVSDSVLVTHPNVTVSNVVSVKSSLNISVPAKGGYSVSGPVVIGGAKVSTLDMDFNDTSGEVEILVSGPLKEFKAKNIAASSSSEKIGLNSTFSMTSAKYELSKDTRISFDKGTIDLSGSIERSVSGIFRSVLSIEEVPLSSLLRVSKRENADEFAGIIRAFSANVSGNLNDPKKTLCGEGSLVFGERLYSKFSLWKSVANILSTIPGFGKVSKEEDPDEDIGQLESKADFTVEDEKFRIYNIYSPRKRYTFRGDVKVDFDKNLEGEGKVIFFRETAGSLAFGIDKLANIAGSVSEVSIPLTLGGTLSDLDVELDKVKFAKQYSGLGLVQSTLGTIGGVLTKPFRGKKKEKEEE